MSLISYGATVRITAAFTDPDTGDAIDPSVVRLFVKQAGETETQYVYNTDSELTRLATGSYQALLAPPAANTTWHYRWEAVDSSITSADPGSFIIGPNRA